MIDLIEAEQRSEKVNIELDSLETVVNKTGEVTSYNLPLTKMPDGSVMQYCIEQKEAPDKMLKWAVVFNDEDAPEKKYMLLPFEQDNPLALFNTPQEGLDCILLIFNAEDDK